MGAATSRCFGGRAEGRERKRRRHGKRGGAAAEAEGQVQFADIAKVRDGSLCDDDGNSEFFVEQTFVTDPSLASPAGAGKENATPPSPKAPSTPPVPSDFLGKPNGTSKFFVNTQIQEKTTPFTERIERALMEAERMNQQGIVTA